MVGYLRKHLEQIFYKYLLQVFLGILIAFVFGLLWKFSNLYYFEEKEAYATLITGVAAVIAAIITVLSFKMQIDHDRSMRNIAFQRKDLERKIEECDKFIKEERYLISVANIIVADISALISRIEDLHLLGRRTILTTLYEVATIPIGSRPDLLRIDLDYHKVFEAMIKDIKLLPTDLTQDVCRWYVMGLGYIETMRMANKRVTTIPFNPDLEGDFVYAESVNLVARGKAVVDKLNIYVRQKASSENLELDRKADLESKLANIIR